MKSIIGYAQADFETLITDNKLYVDRTAYIQALENESNTNLIFVRPRRFGKTFNMSMLRYFFEKTPKSHAALFDSLNISRSLNLFSFQNLHKVL